jgi:hypothetical protein
VTRSREFQSQTRTKQIIILGTGGNCIDILDTLHDINDACGRAVYQCRGFLDDAEQKWGTALHGIKILGPLGSAHDYPDCNFVNGIGSPANFWRKQEIIAKTALPPERFATIVHPTASVLFRASKLAHRINAVFPEEPFHLIGHSMGGLDARYMIAKLGMEVGEQAVISEAAKFGLTTRVPAFPSIHIGSADVIPLEIIADAVECIQRLRGEAGVSTTTALDCAYVVIVTQDQVAHMIMDEAKGMAKVQLQFTVVADVLPARKGTTTTHAGLTLQIGETISLKQRIEQLSPLIKDVLGLRPIVYGRRHNVLPLSCETQRGRRDKLWRQ